MEYSNWTDPQFLDANGIGGMNLAETTVSGSIASAGSGAWAVPGLLAPETMTVSFSGLVATVGLPKPWGIVASSGAVVQAHGALTGTDTTNYSVSFASLVPASGSLTAYLAATITQIQQNPFAITGPPQGDPAYNPNFVPTVGYATNQYSVALGAVSGAVIDNVSTFELFRTTLVSGQTTITTYNTVGQARAGNRKAWPGATLASGGVLTPAQAQTILSPGVSGLTHTLPLASAAGGLTYGFVNGTASWTIAASGTDTIAGFGSTISIPSSGSVALWGNAASGVWDIIAASPNMTPHGSQTYATPGTFTFTVPAGVTYIKARYWGGGGGGLGSSSFNCPGGGGGGGGYGENLCSVTPGESLTIVVGAGGTAGTQGGSTSITGTALSVGAVGGQGGTQGNSGSPGTSGNGGTATGNIFQFTGGGGNTIQPGGAGTFWISTAGASFGAASQQAAGAASSTSAGGGQFPGGGSTGATAGTQPGTGGQVILEW